VVNFNGNEEEDSELQAAIAASLEIMAIEESSKKENLNEEQK
jgi:hypothetical protein